MSNEPSSLGVAHTFSSMLRTRGAEFLNNDRLRLDTLLDEAKSIFLNGLDAVSTYITHAALGDAPPDEPVVLQTQLSNSHQAMNTDGLSEAAQMQHLPLNSTSSLTLVPADLGETGQPPAGGETVTRSRRTWMWIWFIVGLSSLIVVPGVVLGFVTGQLPWGISLCGAIATVASLFASLYYHNNPVRA